MSVPSDETDLKVHRLLTLRGQPVANFRGDFGANPAYGGYLIGDIVQDPNDGKLYLSVDGTLGIPNTDPVTTSKWCSFSQNGGVQYWIESSTGNSSIWSPVAPNQNAVVMPTGTGAFQLDSAGNPRGSHAVDLQRSRLGPTQVASGDFSSIGGGRENRANGLGAAVAGGSENSAAGVNASIGGGSGNSAFGSHTSVGGGNSNFSGGKNSTVSGGDRNRTNRDNATVGGGFGNVASGEGSTVGGGDRNVTGPTADHATIGGGTQNVTSGSRATVGGGDRNQASESRATVGGGDQNQASGNSSVVGGGSRNQASGVLSAISGGSSNLASGFGSGVGGGIGNEASGKQSAIPGGTNNEAIGDFSFCAGESCRASASASVAVGKFNQDGPIGGFERILMVGNGASTVSRSNLFSVTADGTVRGSAFVTAAADLAEWMESSLSVKIPRGTAVVLSDGKIRPTQSGEEPFAVISTAPGLIGNEAETEWIGKYQRTPEGQILLEEISVTREIPLTREVTRTRLELQEKTVNGRTVLQQVQVSETASEIVTDSIDVLNPEGEVIGTYEKPRMTSETVLEKRKKLNPLFNPSLPYIPRSQRPEWNLVGFLGQIPVRKGQPVNRKWHRLRELDHEFDLYFVCP